MTGVDRKRVADVLSSNPDRFEVISEDDDCIEFFDNQLESVFRATLADPSPERFEAILHVMPDAGKRCPDKALIIDFLTRLDPAMTAGLSGIYIRAGKRDDRKIWKMDDGLNADEMILFWDSDYAGRLGWHWRDCASVVVNAKAIERDAARAAAEAYPRCLEPGWGALRAREAGKIAFEQFFITLAHEIRHAAIEFPLTDLYCEIYPDPERKGPAREEDLRGEAGLASPDILEEDAENWAIAAFERWRDSGPRGSFLKKTKDKGEMKP